MNHENLLIIFILGVVALVALWLGRIEIVTACIGSLATALTTILKGSNHENSDGSINPPPSVTP